MNNDVLCVWLLISYKTIPANKGNTIALFQRKDRASSFGFLLPSLPKVLRALLQFNSKLDRAAAENLSVFYSFNIHMSYWIFLFFPARLY